MKKCLGVLVLASLMVCGGLLSSLCAQPYLVSDPYPPGTNIDQYEIQVSGTTIPVPPDPSGQYGLKYDLAGMPEGSYTATVRAHNAWGWSEYSDPFEFSANVPGKPVIRIE